VEGNSPHDPTLADRGTRKSHVGTSEIFISHSSGMITVYGSRIAKDKVWSMLSKLPGNQCGLWPKKLCAG